MPIAGSRKLDWGNNCRYMGSERVSDIVAHGEKELNIDLPPTAGAVFGAYFDFLEKQGEHVNLTAICGAEEVARLHFLDSLALLKVASFKNAKVIDIGSGAGFPGVPLKIAEPSLDLTLLDATGKRITFLTALCSLLGIDAACVHLRAEEAAHTAEFREQYNIAVSRAVASFNILCELCLPYVAVGGLFIAMKGAESNAEIEEAQNAIKTLGAEINECVDYKIPGTTIVHRALVVQKKAETPVKYPRRYAVIKRAPL